MFSSKFIALNTRIEREEINDFSFHFKQLDKEKVKFKRNNIIKIGEQTN